MNFWQASFHVVFPVRGGHVQFCCAQAMSPQEWIGHCERAAATHAGRSADDGVLMARHMMVGTPCK